jgi:VWFA-related protein
MRKSYFAVIAILLAAAVAVNGQPSVPAPQYGLSLNIDSLLIDQSSVQLAVTVTSSNDAAIRGLTAANFSVVPEGRTPFTPVVVPFASSEIGVSIVLCLDASGSMSGQPLQDMKDAVCSFIDSLRPQDYLSVITFSDDYRIVAPFSNDRVYLKTAVREITTTGLNSSLFYAVYKSLEKFEERGSILERRFVVVISDGKNEGVDAFDLDDCVEKAGSSDITISAIGFTRGEEIYLQNLEALTSRTGGQYHYAGSDGVELNRQLQESISLARSQYLVTFPIPSGRMSDKFTLNVTTYNFAGTVDFTIEGLVNEFPCPDCGNIYSTRTEMENCLISHDQTQICTECGQEFPNGQALLTHMEAEHSFTCPVCSEAFLTQQELDDHSVTAAHFTCAECDTALVSQTSLDEHNQSEHSSGVPILPILIGLLVVGGIVGGIFFMNKKSQAKVNALQAEMTQREEEHQRKASKLEKEAEARAAEQQVSNTPQPRASEMDSTPERSYGTEVYRGAAPVADKRRTMVGGSIGTVYTNGTLIVTKGSSQGLSYDITKSQVSIGRAPENTIVLNDDTISRNHAVIRFAAGLFQLTDNNSSNGTFVNGSRITETILKSGDLVRFGHQSELKFQGS